ncbi:heme lyase CcmF/NrfE family subunit [Candidatus Marithrix sp. Canyon 246]|uniref:heme lyase CcmF/NrfE family subunit n=1 Tax=Candidatus Marithrix sp. Canyon 246 TaxID=1827136 RepID=UPI00084A040F|nr:heme lyase CcmF/NrfE family subunit [Candidatus Marithrix sp. Canyon 246]
MIPEIGNFALILALSLALVQTIFPLIGAARTIPNWMAVARPAAVGQLFFMSIAFGCLIYAFVYNDFSVIYVATNSNTALPLAYRISAVWGGHEGSLLLWTLILCFWTVAVVIGSRRLPETMAVRVIAVMGFVSVGFLLFMLLTSNPFDRFAEIALIPQDGRDLNPLLQDLGLIIHPPMLYMGYVGFSVAFSFAIAALLGGKLDSAWVRWSRPWTLIAWVFLTFGIVLGSWWAYYELGWGGWWFWDPVENASFMPWLVGTALIHSLAVTEKRGAFKNWSVLLAIIAFSLSLLGTFLVRSGVLTSVHAFATDPERGIFILAFLTVVIGISLLLYAWRAPKVGLGGSFDLVSKETLLLFNNILFVVAAAAVLLGTLYPLFMDALGMGKISVGPPYFSVVFFWIMAPLIFLLGIGPMAGWKTAKNLMSRLWVTFVLSLAIACMIPFMLNINFAIVPGIAAAAWIIFTSVQNVVSKFGRKMPRSFYGMTVAHIGMAVFIVGVTVSNTFSVEKDVRMEPYKPLELAGYHFAFEGITPYNGPNYKADQANIKVFKDDELIAELQPQKRLYSVQKMPMTEAAIDWGFTRDIYVALGEPLGNDGAWSIRIYYKPFIRWIWFGGLLMVLGGLLSATDKRYRIKDLT